MIYPVWKALSDSSHKWGLITSAAADNALFRDLLEKLGLQPDADVASADWKGYLWPFVGAFDGTTLLSHLPDFSTPADIDFGAWKLPAGTLVSAPFTGPLDPFPTKFPLLGFRPTSPSRIGIGNATEAPNAKFVWHFGLQVDIRIGGETPNLPNELCSF